MTNHINKTNIFDKVFTALGFSLSIVFTIAIVPFLFSIGGSEALGIYKYYSLLMMKTIGLTAFAIGIALPIDKTFKFLGHFWLTENQPNGKLILLTWSIFIGIGFFINCFIKQI